MASIASKLARAAVACRFSSPAVGHCSRPVSPCPPRRLYLTGRRMSSGVIVGGYQMEPVTPMPQELIVTAETLKSDVALRAMYEYWLKYYDISRDRDEMEWRFKIFKKKAKFVHKTNNSGLSYKVALNMFADQTTEEVTCKLL